MNKPDMKVTIGSLTLQNPVMTASGTFGYGEEYAHFFDLSRLGAIVVKGISLAPRVGNRPPRIMETASGMLNAVGLQNVGVKAFIEEKLPFLRNVGIPVIANIFGATVDEYVRVAQELCEAGGVSALEVNISCPNVKHGGLAFGADPRSAAEVTAAVKGASSLPVMVKLTPNVTDIRVIASAVEDAGADALSLINTLLGMSIDIAGKRPALRNVTGGLSGPAIKPVALRMVWQAVRSVSIPVVGLGGIATARDALEFFMVGARAVQVGTANFINPRATLEIIEGIEQYLLGEGMTSIDNLIGALITVED